MRLVGIAGLALALSEVYALPTASSSPVSATEETTLRASSTTEPVPNPTTAGTVQTSLVLSGAVTSEPLLSATTSYEALPSSASVQPSTFQSKAVPTTPLAAHPLLMADQGTDLFEQIDDQDPAAKFGSRAHQVQPIEVNQTTPIETNKFYSNLYLGTRNSPAYMEPYTLFRQFTPHAGLCVSQTDDDQKVYGPGSPAKYFLNPVGICSVGIGATEFTSDVDLSLSNAQQMSVNAQLRQGSSQVDLPLVAGQAFITAKYSNAVPNLFTTFAVLELVAVPFSGGYKYRISFNDGKQWLLYAFPENEADMFALQQSSISSLNTTDTFNGFLQIAKVPVGDTTAEAMYDAHAGTYATDITLSGQVTSASASSASYTFNFERTSALGNSLLHFAHVHHDQSITSGATRTSIQLYSPAKGIMTAYAGNSWTMTEPDLPNSVGFLPAGVNVSSYSTESLQKIAAAAQSEISQSFSAQTDLDSMYYSGKGLAKFALICLSVNDVLQDDDLSSYCLGKLKESMQLFIDNQQQYPLVYDTTWGGLISVQGFTNGDLADFGNTWYNDHHYHYGYFVHTAAIIAHLDPTWASGDAKLVINNMVRDVANPSSSDQYYPLFRSFDWFAGHSWSKGLFESSDGKDEESSSEDYNFLYGMKLWGGVIGDKSMSARASLMLAIEKRAMNDYMLMDTDNTVQPAQFIGNYVTGILFENKADHSTYFSTREETIEGIHMIPTTPISPYIRNPTFIQHEWDNKLASIAPTIADGWKGILYADYSIAQPNTGYNFFAADSFKSAWLDGGASLTWYLTFTAGLSGNGTAPVSSRSSSSTKHSTSSTSSRASTSSKHTTSSTSTKHTTSSTPTSTSTRASSSTRTSSKPSSSSASRHTTSSTPTPTSSHTASTSTRPSSSSTRPSSSSTRQSSSSTHRSSATTSHRSTTINSTSRQVSSTSRSVTTVVGPQNGQEPPAANHRTSTIVINSPTKAVSTSKTSSSSAPGVTVNSPTRRLSTRSTTTPSAASSGSSIEVVAGPSYTETTTLTLPTGVSQTAQPHTSTLSGPVVTVLTTKSTAAASGTPKIVSTIAVSEAVTVSASGQPATTSSSSAGSCGIYKYSADEYTCFGDLLCPIMNGQAFQACGGACYDPGMYTCSEGQLSPVASAFTSPAPSTPTQSTQGGNANTCGGKPYDSNMYNCFDTLLCPIDGGVASQPCGGACYDPNIYSCQDSTLVSLAPSGSGFDTCDGQVYDTSSYSCYNGNKLCPILGDGTKTRSCGGACYDPKSYSCVNGNLAPA